MLDRALLGAGFTEEHTIASIGAVVRLRVLSPRELLEAGVTGDVDVRPGARAVATDLRIRSRVLLAACRLPDGEPFFRSSDEALEMPEDDARGLWNAYARAHRRTYDPGTEIEGAMAEREAERGHWVSLLRARYASDLVAFYGLRSALDATPVQVSWFHRLRRETDDRAS